MSSALSLFLSIFDLHYHLFVSAASDVDPSNVVGLGTTEPAIADKDAVEQTAREQPVEQPTVASMAETAEEDQAQVKAGASTPTRDNEATRTPPPSSVAEAGDKVLTPPPAEEERAPTLAPAKASTPKGSPSWAFDTRYHGWGWRGRRGGPGGLR